MFRETSQNERAQRSSNGIADVRIFERSSWRNWTMMMIVLIITTIGLVTALPPLISDRGQQVWPWPKTEFALLFAYSLLIMAFAAFLTYQQRRILAMHRRSEKEREDRSRRNTSRLYALLNVSSIMGNETDLQGVFDCITRMCVETFDCEQASLMLFDNKSRELEVLSAYGHVDPTEILGRRRAIGEGVAGWVAEHRQPLILGKEPDENCPPELQLNSPQISAAMIVPIILRNELVGVINVSARDSETRFEEEDLHALQVFASNAGTCIRHTEQATWMRQVILAADSKALPKPARHEAPRSNR
jgi:transcriptional regulator with GAF, ATPase, and Fis domain